MDCWNSQTFDAELESVFVDHSEIIVEYFREDQRLMREYLKQNRRERLKPNKYSQSYNNILEHIITPKLVDRTIRVWHYSRLLDEEVESMKVRITPSTLKGLDQRLNYLVKKRYLTKNEARIVFEKSPFHSQNDIRTGRFWSVTVPSAPDCCDVDLLLESWGGESAYFWLSNEKVAKKLKNIGEPRVVEIETQLRDNENSYLVARTAAMAWAKGLGVDLRIEGCDFEIKDLVGSTHVVNVHTKGDRVFKQIAKTYPGGCSQLLAGD